MATAEDATPARPIRRDAALAVALAAFAVALYWPSLGHGFVNLDDGGYVFLNPRVLNGLTADGLLWAATTNDEGHWHPLTWLSLQLDTELGGGPAAYHRTSVALHATNAALLFLVLRAATGARWRPVAAAALWAAHPLRVESVAWVSERKDVLSAFFGLLAVAAYVRYAKAPSSPRYWLVPPLLALSLLAKPMLVTLPAALLLLDWWPLVRVRRAADWMQLVWEKVPLVMLVALSSYVTTEAMMLGGGLGGGDLLEPERRVGDAAVAYPFYLVKTFAPTGLAVIYPRVATPRPVWQPVAALVLVAAVTALAVRVRRRCPAALVGWLWFLGTLVPVGGIVPIGRQTYADRYTYWPHVGLFVALAWGGAAVAGRWRVPAAVAAVAACAILTRQQIAHWRDSLALWRHAVAAEPGSVFCWTTLGRAYLGTGEWAEAVRCCDEASRLEPDNLDAYRVRELAVWKLTGAK